jgi:hypothetical protein
MADCMDIQIPGADFNCLPKKIWNYIRDMYTACGYACNTDPNIPLVELKWQPNLKPLVIEPTPHKTEFKSMPGTYARLQELNEMINEATRKNKYGHPDPDICRFLDAHTAASLLDSLETEIFTRDFILDLYLEAEKKLTQKLRNNNRPVDSEDYYALIDIINERQKITDENAYRRLRPAAGIDQDARGRLRPVANIFENDPDMVELKIT